jgi:HlyD family secretion protein
MRIPTLSRRSAAAAAAAALLVLSPAGCTPPAPQPLWGSGTLEADEVVIAPTIGGRLLARPVAEGDRVRAGQVLALIDSTALVEARALTRVSLDGVAVQRRQAETALASAGERREQALRNRDRLAALRSSQAVAQAQLDEAETALALAQQQVTAAETAFDALRVQERQIGLQLASLQRQIGECRVLAPRDGTVLTTYLEAGEVAAPGQGILRIADLSGLFVRVYVPAAGVGRVRLGGEARVRVDAYPGRVFEGRVVHIAEEAEFTPKNVQTAEARAELVYAVKVHLANPEGLLKIGLPADVDLPEIVPEG